MIKYISYTILVLSFFLIGACNDGKSSIELENQAVAVDDSLHIQFAPLYQGISLYPSMSAQEQQQFIDSMNIALKALSVVYREDMTNRDILLDFSKRPVTTMFTPAVEKLLPQTTLDSITAATSIALSALKSKLPSVHIPDFYSIISPYDRSIYMVDSVMLIALNHYLGYNFDGYTGMSEYKRLAKKPDRIPYNIIEAIVAINYPYTPSEKPTAIESMLYSGAIALAQMQCVKDSKLEEVLSVTSQQLDWLQQNESKIWDKMVADQIIFSTDPAVAERLILQSPSTSIIHHDAPGRTGVYIGYRILLSYSKNHPKTTLQTMINSNFYNDNSVLRESAYNGK